MALSWWRQTLPPVGTLGLAEDQIKRLLRRHRPELDVSTPAPNGDGDGTNPDPINYFNARVLEQARSLYC